MTLQGGKKSRLRSTLLTIILITIPCYCLGLLVMQVDSVARRAGTSTPTTTAPAATNPPSQQTKTPLYPTLPALLTPTITRTPTKTVPPTITPTFPPPPTRTPSPSPTITQVPPTWTPITPTNTPVIVPTDTLVPLDTPVPGVTP